MPLQVVDNRKKYNLVVAPPKKQPKVVVRSPKKQPKVVVTQPKRQPTLKVVNHYTGNPYNPQRQSAYNPQRQNNSAIAHPKPKIQAPVKRRRTYTKSVLQSDGTIKKVTEQGDFTDNQWQYEQRVIKRTKAKLKELDRYKKIYGDDFRSKELWVRAGQTEVDLLVSRTEAYITHINKELASYTNKFEDESLSYEQKLNYYYQYLDLAESRDAWLEKQAIEYDAISRAYADVMGELQMKDARGIFEKGVSGTLGKIWEYSLGSGTENIPSLIDTPKRVLNLIGNTITDRTIEHGVTGERVNTGDMSIGDKWKATQKQRTIMTTRRDDDTSGFWEILQKVTNPAYMTPDGRAYIEKVMRGDTYADREAKRNGEFDPADVPALQRFMETVGESILTDPTTYVGASGVTKLKNAWKASKAGKYTKNVIKHGKKYGDEIIEANVALKKAKKAIKWLGDDASSFTKRKADIKQKYWDDLEKQYKKLRSAGDEIEAQKLLAKGTIDTMFVDFSDDMLVDFQKYKIARASGKNADEIIKGYTPKMKQMFRKADDQFEKMMDDLWVKEKLAGSKADYLKDYFSTESGRLKFFDRIRKIKRKFDKGNIFDDGLSEGFEIRRKAIPAKAIKGSKFKERQARRIAQSMKYTGTGGFGKQKKALDQIKEIQKYLDDIDKTVRRTKWERATALPEKAMRTWKQSVLLGRPAWFVNNEIYNTVAGITGGGVDFIRLKYGFAKLGKRTAQLTKKQQKEVVGYFDDFIDSGKGVVGLKQLAKGASKQENWSRQALYWAFRDKGRTHDDAVKLVNKWLFDYQAKNWERPFRTIAPFWLWQKNIAKRVATMPLDTPRGAKFWSEFYKQAYEQPLNQLPDKTMHGTDPHTGEVWKFNPRDAKRGKLYIAGRWINTPFNAFTPDGVSNIGVNPLITAYNEIASNKDRFGRSLDDINWQESLLRQIPQYNLYNAFREAGIIGEKDIKFEKWLAQGSGLPKQAQGHDPTKPNYRPELDPTTNWSRALLSWLGAPSGLVGDSGKFDSEKFEEDYRYGNFNRDWFSHDWETIFKEKGYEEALRMQEELARKYGFDLTKDIYNDRWARYDAGVTKKIKAQKEAVRQETKRFWAGYNKLPKGTGERTKYIQEQRIKWKKEKTFEDNPYVGGLYQDFFFVFKEDRKGFDGNGLDLSNPEDYMKYDKFWDDYWKADKETRRKMARDNPQYMKQGIPQYAQSEKSRFWKEYWRLKDESEVKARKYYNDNYREDFGGKNYKDSAKGKFWSSFFAFDDRADALRFYRDNYKKEYGGKKVFVEEGLFWIGYYNSNPDVRKQLLKDNPQYAKYQYTPKTADEWEQVREENRQKKYAKFADNKQFQARLSSNKRAINKRATQYRMTRSTRKKKVIWKG